jgi:AcrR family transcriptional regulator
VPPKKERTRQLRDRLLDAAIDVLAEDGVAAVTTRAVAARAGTTAPAIYELFTDKAGLVRAVFFKGFEQLGGMLEALPDPTGTPDEITATVEVFRAFTRSHPRLFEVMYSRPFADFQPSPDEQALGDTTRAALVARARACVDAGHLTGDPVDIAHAVLGLAIGLATQEAAGWLGSTPRDRTRRWNAAVEALVAGFGSSPR